MAVKTMNVSLSDELASYIEGQVGTGHYTSNSELVREAIRDHMEKRAARARAMAQVDRELEEGLAALKQGRVVSAEDAIRSAQALIDEIAVD